MKTFTVCLMFLIGVASIAFAQVQSVSQADTAPGPLILTEDMDRMSSDQPILVAQAPAQAPAQDMTCRNPKTGQPDRIVQSFLPVENSSYLVRSKHASITIVAAVMRSSVAFF